MTRREKGLTLIELMVVTTIGAMFITSTLPSFQAYFQDLRLRSVQERLVTDLHAARFAAIDRNNDVQICSGNRVRGCTRSPHWDQGWIVFSDGNGDRAFQDHEELLAVSGGLTRVTVNSSPSRTKLRFSAFGTAGGSNATLWLCDRRGATRARLVRISLSGRIRASLPSPDDGDGC